MNAKQVLAIAIPTLIVGGVLGYWSRAHKEYLRGWRDGYVSGLRDVGDVHFEQVPIDTGTTYLENGEEWLHVGSSHREYLIPVQEERVAALAVFKDSAWLWDWHATGPDTIVRNEWDVKATLRPGISGMEQMVALDGITDFHCGTGGNKDVLTLTLRSGGPKTMTFATDEGCTESVTLLNTVDPLFKLKTSTCSLGLRMMEGSQKMRVLLTLPLPAKPADVTHELGASSAKLTCCPQVCPSDSAPPIQGE